MTSRSLFTMLVCAGLAGGCSSSNDAPDPRDASVGEDASVHDGGIFADAGEIDAGTPDAGMPDAGSETPEVCRRLDLSAQSFQPGGTDFEFGSLAGDFTVNLLDNETWRFQEAWTGCESYVFLSYIPTRAGVEAPWWRSDIEPLMDTPDNAHFFFISWESTPEARQARVSEIKSRLFTELDAQNAPEEVRMRQLRRFHFVTDAPFDIEGSVGSFLQDYMQFQGNPENFVDLGDRGMAPAPLPFALGIDRDQQWDSGGSMSRFVGGSYAFRMASYLPQFFDHKARIRDAQANETGVWQEVLLEGRVTERVFDIDLELPSADAMADYDTLEVDVSVHCPHRNVFACSEWDRIARISVCQDTECMTRRELVRWITPYWRRGTRRWVIDASSLMGLVQAGGTQRFRIQMGPSWERATERDVRIALRLSQAGRANRADEAVYAFGGGAFNDTYNTREPFAFTPPVDATRVELVLLLSGHGQDSQTNCSEWCDHRHRFSVNGTALEEIRHVGAIGSEAGCGPAASEGASPGQYGNWAPERAYWCPGIPVSPIVIDITDHIQLGQTSTVTYEASLPNGAPGGGNIDLSTYVTWSR